ncbi:MAG: hypothetical protein IT457_14850 [Planctomycetes bacterium]|nr:hypothetical protein [Planctomycetota bacterium]
MARRLRCPQCLRLTSIVHVHGHAQCVLCGTNVEPCCSGAGDEADAVARGGESADLEALLALLAALGGSTPREALLNGFAERTAVSLDVANEVLGRALRAGQVIVHAGIVALPDRA